MLIESYKAKAHLERVAKFDPTSIKADSSLEDMLEMVFGPRPQMAKNAGLAVIPIKGVIGNGISEIDKMTGCCDVEDIEEMLEDAERDDNIKVIIFDVDSPGGTVTGVPELAKRIRKCKKRTIGWTCKQACSGGYWLLSQCDEVWVSGSSIVANIGCFMGFLNEAKAYEMEGYKIELFKSGWAKAAGYPGTDTTPEQRALFNADVKETHDWFIADVLSTRSMAKVEDMRSAFEGVDHPAGGVDQGLATRDHVLRRKVALHAARDLNMFRPPFRRHRIVQRHAIGPRGLGEPDVA